MSVIMLRTSSNALFRNRVINIFVCYSSQNKDTSKNINDNPEEVTKESLQWRTPWQDKKDQWYSKFKVFGSDHNNADIIKFLQTPINLSPTSIKKWWQRKQLEKEIFFQQYIPERNRILGNDLAAAHFIVHRGGSVKFVGEKEWIKQDENQEYKLPNKFVPGKIIEAIDCSNMQLHFEGLGNLRGLKKLNWLSLNNCQYMDDWCMDRICGMLMLYENLKYLDIRNCPKITDRGVGALYKIKSLQTLYVDNIQYSKAFELTCLMLQELSPNLEIKM